MSCKLMKDPVSKKYKQLLKDDMGGWLLPPHTHTHNVNPHVCPHKNSAVTSVMLLFFCNSSLQSPNAGTCKIRLTLTNDSHRSQSSCFYLPSLQFSFLPPLTSSLPSHFLGNCLPKLDIPWCLSPACPRPLIFPIQ